MSEKGQKNPQKQRGIQSISQFGQSSHTKRHHPVSTHLDKGDNPVLRRPGMGPYTRSFDNPENKITISPLPYVVIDAEAQQPTQIHSVRKRKNDGLFALHKLSLKAAIGLLFVVGSLSFLFAMWQFLDQEESVAAQPTDTQPPQIIVVYVTASPKPSENIAFAQGVVTASGPILVYRGAGDTYPLLDNPTYLLPGTVVDIAGKDISGQWVKILIGNSDGWVSREFVTLQQSRLSALPILNQ